MLLTLLSFARTAQKKAADLGGKVINLFRLRDSIAKQQEHEQQIVDRRIAASVENISDRLQKEDGSAYVSLSEMSQEAITDSIRNVVDILRNVDVQQAIDDSLSVAPIGQAPENAPALSQDDDHIRLIMILAEAA